MGFSGQGVASDSETRTNWGSGLVIRADLRDDLRLLIENKIDTVRDCERSGDRAIS